MTALINDRATPERTVKTLGLPVAVGTPICFKGARACIDTTTGLCVPGKASTTLVPVGLFAERVDNRTGAQTVLAQVNLDREILLRWYANDGTVIASSLLQDCYLADDQTVTMNATGASKSGRVWQVDAVRGVAVETGAATSAAALARLIVQNGSSQSVPSGAPFTTITGWTEIVDNANAFDPVTGLYTVPATGFYQVNAALTTNGVPQANNIFLAVQINGTAQLQGVFTNAATAGTSANASVAVGGLVQATKGDVLKLGLTQFSGGPVSLFAGAVDNFLTIAQLS